MKAKAIRSYYVTGEEAFGPGLKISAIVHVGLILFVLIKSVFFPSSAETYIPALRVDVVGLPDQLKKDLRRAPISKEVKAALEKKIKPPPEIAKKDEMVFKPKKTKSKAKSKKKRKKKIKNALARIRALEKIKGEVPDQVKGNIVSAGKSLSANAQELATLPYYDTVLDQIRKHWSLPVWLARQNLSAQVSLSIDARGYIRGLRFKKSSGNPQFDEAVRSAISQSEPFEPPPKEYQAAVLADGILLGFPL